MPRVAIYHPLQVPRNHHIESRTHYLAGLGKASGTRYCVLWRVVVSATHITGRMGSSSNNTYIGDRRPTLRPELRSHAWHLSVMAYCIEELL